jgi:hypothetical protein
MSRRNKVVPSEAEESTADRKSNFYTPFSFFISKIHLLHINRNQVVNLRCNSFLVATATFLKTL